MKPLKAFRKICRCLSSSYEFTDEYKNNKKLIENALKRLEMIETKGIPKMKRNYAYLKEERNILRNQRSHFYLEKEQQDKVLEILKEKEVDISWLLDTETVYKYNTYIDNKLTEEEYELLKMVLK